MILYKNTFNKWVEITEEQKEKLVNHLSSGITTMSGDEKKKYIQNKFKHNNDSKEEGKI